MCLRILAERRQVPVSVQVRLRCQVSVGEEKMMVDEKQGKQGGQQTERNAPGPGDCLLLGVLQKVVFFQISGKHDQKPLAGNHGQPVERISDPHKVSLFFSSRASI